MNDVIDNDTGELYEVAPIEMSGAVAAEISQQVATAKRYPRRPDKVISTEIMSRATLDEETAAECVYSLPRAGKDITGPSVRFAEIVFASFGNMRAGARFVEIDTKDPARAAVIIEGVCIDMQMNNGQTVPVRRSITGKKGVFNADMTNIAFSAGAAIARREAILKTVPKSIWGAAWKQVLAVLQGDVKTLAARRRSALEAFQKMGVDPSKVCEALGVAGEESITLEQMPRLIGMWTALRDGTETIESLFGRGGHMHDTVQNPLKDDPAPRGDMKAFNNANTVIDPDGKVVKCRDGLPAAPIIDQRFTPAQTFDSIEAWNNAVQRMPQVEFPGKQDRAESGASSDKSGPKTEQTEERSETASNEGGKSDVASGASGKPTGEASASGGDEHRPTAKNDQTASQTKPGPGKPAKPYDDAAGYMSYMRDFFDTAKNKASLTELWGSTRADRNELLSPEQIEELTKDKDAKLAGLKLKDAK